jgi:anti-sigma B factor antagonist
MPETLMGNEHFNVTQESSVNILALSIPDGLDTMEIDALIDSIMEKINPNATGKWVVDLTQVKYMGSMMLGLMVNIRERIRMNGGKVVLCGLSPQMARIFQNCCLERLFTIVKTRPDAITAVKR